MQPGDTVIPPSPLPGPEGPSCSRLRLATTLVPIPGPWVADDAVMSPQILLLASGHAMGCERPGALALSSQTQRPKKPAQGWGPQPWPRSAAGRQQGPPRPGPGRHRPRRGTHFYPCEQGSGAGRRGPTGACDSPVAVGKERKEGTWPGVTKRLDPGNPEAAEVVHPALCPPRGTSPEQPPCPEGHHVNSWTLG